MDEAQYYEIFTKTKFEPHFEGWIARVGIVERRSADGRHWEEAEATAEAVGETKWDALYEIVKMLRKYLESSGGSLFDMQMM
jgi:hypothetical protein